MAVIEKMIETVNPILVFVSSLIIIITPVAVLFRRSSKRDGFIVTEIEIKTRNGIERLKKTENEHLQEALEENKRLKIELSVIKRDFGPYTKSQRFAISLFLIIFGSLLLRSLPKASQKKE